MPDMLRSVGVLLMSSLSYLLLDKRFEEFSIRDCNVSCRDRMAFIPNRMMDFPSTRTGSQRRHERFAQRDATQHLDTLERTAYEISRNVGLRSNHTTATVDDDWYGIHVNDNQVKYMSSGKVDKELHSADTICGAFFRMTHGVRFQRRGNHKSEILSYFWNICGWERGLSLRGNIDFVDKGYGYLNILNSFLVGDEWCYGHAKSHPQVSPICK